MEGCVLFVVGWTEGPVCVHSPLPPGKKALNGFGFLHSFLDDLTSCLPPQSLHANRKAVVTQLETGARPSGVAVAVT